MSTVVDAYRLHLAIYLDQQHDSVVDHRPPIRRELDVQKDPACGVNPVRIGSAHARSTGSSTPGDRQAGDAPPAPSTLARSLEVDDAVRNRLPSEAGDGFHEHRYAGRSAGEPG